MLVKLLLATIFLTTGISKLRQPLTLAIAIGQMTGIRSKRLQEVSAFLLILAEIVAGIGILTPVHNYQMISSILMNLMLLGFSVVVIMNLLRGTVIHCNCGGILGSDLISKEIPIRNFILIGAIAYDILFSETLDLVTKFSSKEGTLEVFLWEVSVLAILFMYRMVKQAKSILQSNHVTH